jgi:hypothetical protein
MIIYTSVCVCVCVLGLKCQADLVLLLSKCVVYTGVYLCCIASQVSSSLFVYLFYDCLIDRETFSKFGSSNFGAGFVEFNQWSRPA